jgi:2-oxoglutarate dehydrogenase E2 component (dihydrolipoamide succinyltransferase)
MSVEVKINELPESVADGTLVVWHKQPGDSVQAGEALAELETDKVVLELSAPAGGVLGPHLRKRGETVKRGDVITTIDESAAQPAPSSPKSAPALSGPAAQPAVAAAGGGARPESAPVKTSATAPAEASAPASDALSGLAPAVRRLMAEHQLSPADITGSGPRGRITKEDVLRYLEHSPQLASKIGEAAPEVRLSDEPAAPGARLASRPTTRVKLTRLRARIAERMLEAQRSAAILTTFNEINMQALTDLRHNYREVFAKQHGVKLGIMGFFVRACAEALRRYPVVNASLDGDDIVYHGYFDIGVAVSTARGLVVPVLRDADKLTLAEIERAIAGFASRGEEGKLGIDELTGGTFSISNGGVFGSMLSTPILNPPQSAILGLHRIEQRPIAEGDKVVIRPMMYVALSYDHRLIDGRDAVLFLVAVKELIEDPTRFLLKV